MGMPAMSPPPSHANSRLRLETGRPLLTTNARPRAVVNMPSVTMNGGTRPQVTTTPLAAPQTPPASTPIAMGTMTGYWPGWAKQAATTPESATTDPNDRSTPPVSST